MTRGGRVLLGSMLGAALTLLIHPISRPYLLSAVVAPSLRATDVTTHNNSDKRPELAAWLHDTCDLFASHKDLTSQELQRAISAAQDGEMLDRDNAFWPQVLAWLRHVEGKEAEAKKEWLRASVCASWNDYQTALLSDAAVGLESAFGGTQAWQLAYLYFQRSENAARMIASYARTSIQGAPLDTREGILLRAANVRNGDLLRSGSRSIRIGGYGVQIAEIACQPAGMAMSSNHHRLFLARMNYYDSLRKIGEPDLASQVNRIYREVDAWNALTSEEEALSNAQDHAYESLLTANLPGTFAIIGVVGLGIWLIGRVLYRVQKIPIEYAVGIGLVLGIGSYAVTRLMLAGIAPFLCSLFLVLNSRHQRQARGEDLGPMFSFSIGTLGVVFALLFGAFVLGQSASSASMLPNFSVPPEYFGGSGVLLGLSIIIVALVLLVAPWFAIALRYSTPFVVGTAVRKFGAFLAYFGLIVVVFGTPLCIYEDRGLSQSLNQLVMNEPVVYYKTLQR